MAMTMQSVSQLEETADKVKDLVLGQLIVDGLLTGDEAKVWSRTHTIIYKRLSKISGFYKQLLGKAADPTVYDVLVATIPDLAPKQGAL